MNDWYTQNVDGSQQHYTEQKQAVSTDCILYNSIDAIFSKQYSCSDGGSGGWQSGESVTRKG
jgi:hypothetical protein